MLSVMAPLKFSDYFNRFDPFWNLKMSHFRIQL